MNSQHLTLPEGGQLSMSYFSCTTNKTQQNSIEVEIETKKSHKKHFETKVKELQDTIRKAEREHENMKKLVRVRISLIRLHIPELGHVGHMNSFFFISGCNLYNLCLLPKEDCAVMWQLQRDQLQALSGLLSFDFGQDSLFSQCFPTPGRNCIYLILTSLPMS